MTYAAPATFVARPPKLAVFSVGTVALGQVKSFEWTASYDVEEIDYPRLGDPNITTIEGAAKAKNDFTLRLYEMGSDRSELQLVLGVAASATGSITLTGSASIATATFDVFPTNTVGATADVTYTVLGMLPRSWSVGADASGKEILHTITGKFTSCTFPGTA